MANFDTSGVKRQAVHEANNLLELVQAAHGLLRTVEASLAKYQAATDPTFNAAVNALFTTSERTELGVIIGKMKTLADDLTANHAGALAP